MSVDDLPKSSAIAEAAIALIEKWLADESGYDEEIWPKLKQNLEKNRLSSRKLFRE